MTVDKVPPSPKKKKKAPKGDQGHPSIKRKTMTSPTWDQAFLQSKSDFDPDFDLLMRRSSHYNFLTGTLKTFLEQEGISEAKKKLLDESSYTDQWSLACEHFARGLHSYHKAHTGHAELQKEKELRKKASLDNNAPYALCTTKLSTLLSYLTGPTVGNVSDCRAYTASYATSLSDQYGPTSPRHRQVPLRPRFFLPLLRCKKRMGLLARGKEIVLASGLDSMNQSTTVIRFTFDEIKKNPSNPSKNPFEKPEIHFRLKQLSVADMECVVQGIIETQLVFKAEKHTINHSQFFRPPSGCHRSFQLLSLLRSGLCLTNSITGILLIAEVITHIESKPVDSAIVHCLVGFFKDELGLIPSAFTFAADNRVPGCWLVFPCLLFVDMSSGGNKDIPETSSPAAKSREKGTMKGKKPKYVIKLPLQKAPVVESPIVQPNPSEAENVVPIPSQPSVVELTHSQPSIVQPMPSQPPIVQPMQPNINQPMSSQPLPSSMGSQCAAARCTSLSSPSQQNASPISMPSRDNQNVFQEEFQTLFSQAKSEAASCGGGEETSPLDHVEEEKLRNKRWLVVAGGKNPKGRVYGVGKLNEGYLSRKTFTQKTSSSAADSQKIIRLEEEICQSREDFRRSREENQRLQRKLESLVNAILPLLPPAAQIILQDMNEQPQNDHQNQNHA
ncbi:hypothetical protein Fmac_001354 [Flemingia macrophylla]|uniref:Uncharacterized protein n=1 Tax=Flemingia macrophylla TaxID=520843 RepID=A0ABD1NGV5_9FABA